MAQIRSIQLLRAIAALAVAFGHLQSECLTMPAAATSGYSPILLDLTGAGVDLFFIISGFVMVYASRDLFECASGGSIFLRRRIARIVPLYWLMTTLFLLTIAAMPHALSSAAPNAVEILKSYFFVPYAHAGSNVIQPVYKLGWTLNYEMFFYVVFAALLFLPMRAAIYAIATLFSLLVLAGATIVHPPGILAFLSHPIVLEFVMGAFVAMAFLEGWRLPRYGAFLLLLFGFSGFGLTTLSGFDTHGSLRPLLWGLPATMIVAAAVSLETVRNRTGRVFAIFVALGDSSYALYLLHPMAIRVLRLVWDHIGLSRTASPWLFIGLAIVLLLHLSVAVHYRIERPMTRFVQRFLAKAPTAPATVQLAESTRIALPR